MVLARLEISRQSVITVFYTLECKGVRWCECIRRMAPVDL